MHGNFADTDARSISENDAEHMLGIRCKPRAMCWTTAARDWSCPVTPGKFLSRSTDSELGPGGSENQPGTTQNLRTMHKAACQLIATFWSLSTILLEDSMLQFDTLSIGRTADLFRPLVLPG